MWAALDEACQREDMTRHQLCNRIAQHKRASTLTAAIRVFIVSYFRAAATDAGHSDAGHGALLTPRSRPA